LALRTVEAQEKLPFRKLVCPKREKQTAGTGYSLPGAAR
jgi:hypothetical protein